MARSIVRLAPAGYFRIDEPGVDWKLTAPELAAKFGDAAKSAGVSSNFWNPPQTEWLLPIPRQLSPRWYANPNISEHVINLWTYAAGITAVEAEFTRAPGVTFPDNKWKSFLTPASFTALDNTDWAAMATAAEEVAGTYLFPENFGTVAQVVNSPQALSMEDLFTPAIAFATWPAPYDTFAFGFSNLAFVYHDAMLYILRSPNNDKQTWELVTYRNMDAGAFGGSQPYQAEINSRMTFRPDIAAVKIRSMIVVPVGRDELHLLFGTGHFVNLKWRKATKDSVAGAFPAGPWWIASAPDHKLYYRVEVVGYDSANTDVFNIPTARILFDLPYAPTVAPELGIEYVFHNRNYSGTVPLVAQETLGDDSTKIYMVPSGTGEELIVDLWDEDLQHWESDGVRKRGTYELRLTPANGDPAVSTYSAPQVRSIEVRFPPKITDLSSGATDLTDSEWATFRAEASFWQPEGKHVTVIYNDRGDQKLVTAGLNERDYFPMEILSAPATRRIAGWISSPETLTLKSEGPTPPNLTNPLLQYALHADGLLKRCDQKFLYLPNLLNPTAPNGAVEHTFVIEQVLKGAGFDVTDTTRVKIAPDPNTGTAAAQLPGAWGTVSGRPGWKLATAWAPKWDQTRIQYMLWIARGWAGWNLYERLNGQIQYHPNLFIQVALGRPYFVAATIYRTTAEASSAGFPDQYMWTDEARTVTAPEANIVRVTGVDMEEDPAAHVIDRDPRSLTDDTYENYVGDYRPDSIVDELGVTLAARQQLARVKLLMSSRKRVIRSVTVKRLPPWRIGASGIDVGDVIKIQGRTGHYLVIHIDTTCLKSAADVADEYYETRITGERLPLTTVSGAAVTTSGTAGAYPGVGA